VVSKFQIVFQGKAQADAQSRHGGMSILKRPATQLWGAKWGFETTSTAPLLNIFVVAL
jgi:hypothetical protein